mgnify:CR=1 FL=1
MFNAHLQLRIQFFHGSDHQKTQCFFLHLSGDLAASAYKMKPHPFLQRRAQIEQLPCAEHCQTRFSFSAADQKRFNAFPCTAFVFSPSSQTCICFSVSFIPSPCYPRSSSDTAPDTTAQRRERSGNLTRKRPFSDSLEMHYFQMQKWMFRP